MRSVGLILFSWVFWLVAFLWMGFLAIMTFIFAPLVGYERIHLWIPAPGFYACVRMTLCRFRVTYDPKFDPWRLSVFCQNHVNLLDAHIASSVIPHAFCGLMHAWQFKIPFYGWLMGLSKGIKVYPGKRNLENLVEQAKDRKRAHMSILTFPEGGRTLDGRVQDFRKGVFFMARQAGYPVVPIAVRGNFDINRKGSRVFKPFQTLEVYVGPQYETHGLSDVEIVELSQRLQKQVAAFVEVREPA